MPSIIYLTKTGDITEINLRSTDKYTVENFVFHEMRFYQELGLKFWETKRNLEDHGISYSMFESVLTDDELLNFMIHFNKRYGIAYFNHEIFLEEPTREILEQLKLF